MPAFGLVKSALICLFAFILVVSTRGFIHIFLVHSDARYLFWGYWSFVYLFNEENIHIYVLVRHQVCFPTGECRESGYTKVFHRKRHLQTSQFPLNQHFIHSIIHQSESVFSFILMKSGAFFLIDRRAKRSNAKLQRYSPF